jgi:hypothetical protein
MVFVPHGKGGGWHEPPYTEEEEMQLYSQMSRVSRQPRGHPPHPPPDRDRRSAAPGGMRWAAGKTPDLAGRRNLGPL